MLIINSTARGIKNRIYRQKMFNIVHNIRPTHSIRFNSFLTVSIQPMNLRPSRFEAHRRRCKTVDDAPTFSLYCLHEEGSHHEDSR